MTEQTRESSAAYTTGTPLRKYDRQWGGPPMWERQGWEPHYRQGERMDDPRQELRVIAREAQNRHEEYAAVPVRLLLAAGWLRECGQRRIFLYDEDGPIGWEVEPSICHKPEGHKDAHYNGYYTWTVEESDANQPVT